MDCYIYAFNGWMYEGSTSATRWYRFTLDVMVVLLSACLILANDRYLTQLWNGSCLLENGRDQNEAILRFMPDVLVPSNTYSDFVASRCLIPMSNMRAPVRYTVGGCWTRVSGRYFTSCSTSKTRHI